jgi:TRAP-type uncharacterized transport system substrate-binding protein
MSTKFRKKMTQKLDHLAQYKQRLFETSLRDFATSSTPIVILLLLSLVAAYFYIAPAPTQHVVFSVGREDGEYQEDATRYQVILARDDVALETRQSEGTLENLQRLKDDNSDVDIAFILDGLQNDHDGDLYSLGSVGYQPIWVFYRDKKNLGRLSEFSGKKIAIGKLGSGTQLMALQLLDASGVNSQNAKFILSGHEDGIREFENGQVDAVFLLGQPDSAPIKKLLSMHGVRVLDFDQAAAYTRRFPFLHELVLPHGTIDLQHDIPAVDLHILATTTTLVVRDTLHPAIVSLLMKAMTEVHEGPGLLHKKNTFPQAGDFDFELSPVAEHYYKSGPPFLQRYLPYWVATLIDRMLIVALPIIALLIPFSRTAPQIYRWRIMRRINRWYRELILLEAELRSGKDYDEYLRKLEWIEEESAHSPIPLAFSDHSYVLKEHIDLVRRKISRLKNSSGG